MKDVYLLDLIHGISGTLDYVSSEVTGHHRRVGIACGPMAEALGLGPEDTTDLLVAGLLHDIGAFALQLPLDGLDFDADLTEHSVMGYKLLHRHELLERPATIIKHHHTPWKSLKSATKMDGNTPVLANVVNIVDRVDILNKVGMRTIDRERIRTIIGDYSHTVFETDVVDAFMDVSASDSFWRLLEDDDTPIRNAVGTTLDDRLIPQTQLLSFSRFFSHIIDFRSRHTATHSQGVAETAVQIARLVGMNEFDQLRMRLAGNLHDIGKLSVPVTLLDKPEALNADEFSTVQEHANVCDTLLHSIPGLETIADWACQHHERINGSGYPGGLKGDELSLGSRILAVADVCTALSEDRPYRKGMGREATCAALAGMAEDGLLDSRIVELTITNYDRIDAVRRMVQNRALAEFRRFRDA